MFPRDFILMKQQGLSEQASEKSIALPSSLQLLEIVPRLTSLHHSSEMQSFCCLPLSFGASFWPKYRLGCRIVNIESAFQCFLHISLNYQV